MERIDPIADPRWRRLVEAGTGPTVFAHPAWLELLRRSYRYTLSAVCVLDDAGEIAAGLPLARIDSRLTGRRLVALPFSDVCPPLVRSGAGPEVAEALAGALLEERRSTGLDIEIHGRVPELRDGQIGPRFLVHRLDLDPNPAVVMKGLSKGHRSAIKKSRREGVTVQVGTGRAALETFYRLHVRTRRRLGVPVQPKRFILGFERLFAAGLGYVISAHHAGQPISASVFLQHGDTLTYKYSASDERHLGLRPNNLVLAEGIERGCAGGYGSLDMGRTEADNEGLAAFKRSWGAVEEPLAYTSLAEKARGEVGNPLLHRVIAGLIRRGPQPTAQVIGAALYRHVG